MRHYQYIFDLMLYENEIHTLGHAVRHHHQFCDEQVKSGKEAPFLAHKHALQSLEEKMRRVKSASYFENDVHDDNV
jgi:hypothetical protein